MLYREHIRLIFPFSLLTTRQSVMLNMSARALVDVSHPGHPSAKDTFEPFIRSRTMYYVVANIIKPLTRETQLSYAEMAGPFDTQWFVSCSQLRSHMPSAQQL